MNVRHTPILGVLLFEPVVHVDSRGWIFESFHNTRYAHAGLNDAFVQDNHALSVPGCVRGLHYQRHAPQGKLVRVIRGSAWDVCVDLRRGSPTFGKWHAEILSAENRLQMYIPPGFAHGYAVLYDECELVYKCSQYWNPADECGIRWDDPTLAIPWPLASPILSNRDCDLPFLRDVEAELPRHGE